VTKCAAEVHGRSLISHCAYLSCRLKQIPVAAGSGVHGRLWSTHRGDCCECKSATAVGIEWRCLPVAVAAVRNFPCRRQHGNNSLYDACWSFPRPQHSCRAAAWPKGALPMLMPTCISYEDDTSALAALCVLGFYPVAVILHCGCN
jgi:hypothetical protein